MNTLITIVYLALVPATFSSTIVSGPSGIVTDAGPVALGHGSYGPAGVGLGHSLYGNGPAGLGLGNRVYGPTGVGQNAYGPALDYNLGASSLGHGLGGWNSGTYGGPGYGANGLGVGHDGIIVRGPQTVPATIVGPSGKIVTNGLYGASHVGVQGW